MVLAAGGTVGPSGRSRLTGASSRRVPRSRAAWRLAITPTALAFRTSRVSVSPRALSWAACSQTRSWKVVRSRVSPVTSRWEVPTQSSAPSVATPRWYSRTPQASRPCFSRVSSRCGSWVAMAWATAVSMARHPHDPIRSASWASTDAAAAWDRLWVAWAILRAFHGATAQCFDGGPEAGESVVEVQGVGQQLEPGQGGHPERGGERFGGERRHQRRPLSTQGRLLLRTQTREAGVGPGHEPGLLRGRVQHTPLRRQPGGWLASWRSRTSVAAANAEQPLRVEVTRPRPEQPIRRRFRSCVQSNQTAPTTRPGIGSRPGVVEKYFEEFLQRLLGLLSARGVVAVSGRPASVAPLPWCAERGRGRRPSSFSQSSLTLLCVKAGRVGSFALTRRASP